MKFNDPGLLKEPGEALAPVSLGGDDFLSRVAAAIKNFKQVLEIAKELRGMKAEQGNEPAPRGEAPPGPAFNIGKALAPVLQKYGDKTVSELMENLSPLTLNQIMGMIKSAGFGK